MAKPKGTEFTFLSTDRVGVADAEQDNEYLENCFFDQGTLEVLQSCSDPRCVILGRTGAGKSALLLKLYKVEEYVTRIAPEQLSLEYLSNSTILPQLEEIGVNLGLFYKLLWQHVFVVELIKAKYKLRTQQESKNFFQSIWSIFDRDKGKETAVQYLEKWENEFWKGTEYHIKDVTQKLEQGVKSSLSVNALGQLQANAAEGSLLSSEERAEIKNRLQEIVNATQVRELREIIAMLANDVFGSDQPRYYITIDHLDEDWVDTRFRYRLIRSLIEVVKEFNQKLKGVKILLALRQDLLEKVINKTRNEGFQEEKYQSLYLRLQWDKTTLFELLNMRVQALVRRRYTKTPVLWNDLLPESVGRKGPAMGDYLIERTMYRPRDLIVLFNFAIEHATGRADISLEILRKAEAAYSSTRLNSIYDEWRSLYPNLDSWVKIIHNQKTPLHISDFDESMIEDTCLDLASRNEVPIEFDWIHKVANGDESVAVAAQRICAILYHVGVLGVRREKSKPVYWSFRNSPSLNYSDITQASTLEICPVFYRALSIRNN